MAAEESPLSLLSKDEILAESKLDATKRHWERLSTSGLSKYVGVTWNKSRRQWSATKYTGKTKSHLGYFLTEDEAARAYDRAVLALGRPAMTNAEYYGTAEEREAAWQRLRLHYLEELRGKKSAQDAGQAAVQATTGETEPALAGGSAERQGEYLDTVDNGAERQHQDLYALVAVHDGTDGLCRPDDIGAPSFSIPPSNSNGTILPHKARKQLQHQVSTSHETPAAADRQLALPFASKEEMLVDKKVASMRRHWQRLTGSGMSRFVGVTWSQNRRKWSATKYNGKSKVHLGYFATEEEAARAYDEAVVAGGQPAMTNADYFSGPELQEAAWERLRQHLLDEARGESHPQDFYQDWVARWGASSIVRPRLTSGRRVNGNRRALPPAAKEHMEGGELHQSCQSNGQGMSAASRAAGVLAKPFDRFLANAAEVDPGSFWPERTLEDLSEDLPLSVSACKEEILADAKVDAMRKHWERFSSSGMSKFMGVTWSNSRRKWSATMYNGKSKCHLGYFATEEEAARAYDESVAASGRPAMTNADYFAGAEEREAAWARLRRHLVEELRGQLLKVPEEEHVKEGSLSLITMRGPQIPGRLRESSAVYRGVRRFKHGWSACVKYQGLALNLGTFDNAEDAARIVDRAMYKLKGESKQFNIGLSSEEKGHLDSISKEEFLADVEVNILRQSWDRLSMSGNSRYMGVHWKKSTGKWCAQGKNHVFLGNFATAEEAAMAYDESLLRSGSLSMTNADYFGGPERQEAAWDRLRQHIILEITHNGVQFAVGKRRRDTDSLSGYLLGAPPKRRHKLSEGSRLDSGAFVGEGAAATAGAADVAEAENVHLFGPASVQTIYTRMEPVGAGEDRQSGGLFVDAGCDVHAADAGLVGSFGEEEAEIVENLRRAAERRGERSRSFEDPLCPPSGSPPAEEKCSPGQERGVEGMGHGMYQGENIDHYLRGASDASVAGANGKDGSGGDSEHGDKEQSDDSSDESESESTESEDSDAA